MKITDAMRAQIEQDARAGDDQRMIAFRHGVGTATVRDVMRAAEIPAKRKPRPRSYSTRGGPTDAQAQR